jgi:signal recognition particle subunit SRP54
MFSDLTDKLDSAFKTITGQSTITDVNVAETVREIRKALLDADVSYQVAKQLTDRIREQAMGESVLNAVKPGQQFIKIVYDELVKILGSDKVEIATANTPPTVILVAGLQGSGKTTFVAKLAKKLKAEGKTPLLAAADVYRPAAVEQLKTLASQIDVPVHSIAQQDAVRVAREAVGVAQSLAMDTVILDTAGRMHVDEALMDEVLSIKNTVKPHEILFVVDSMTGQDAVNTAVAFNKQLDISGVVLTKLDGDTRGGAAISIVETVDKPIKFLSTGEKLEDLSDFYPERMAQRILGMGDVVSLVEKAQEQFDEKQAQKLHKKIESNSFDLQDFYNQIQQIKKMGNIKDLVGMIPGMNKAMGDTDVDEDSFKSVEAIILSMTPEERKKPELLNGSRRRRIAQGSGTSPREVNELMNQFKQMKKMMKSMSKFAKMGRNLKNFPMLGR